jgi:hypothetical protein
MGIRRGREVHGSTPDEISSLNSPYNTRALELYSIELLVSADRVENFADHILRRGRDVGNCSAGSRVGPGLQDHCHPCSVPQTMKGLDLFFHNGNQGMYGSCVSFKNVGG